MAASIRSRSTFAGDGAAHLVTSFPMPRPTGTADGDLLLAVLGVGYGSNALAISSVPAGWTLLYASGAIARTNGYDYFWVYTKTAASEPSSWSWTFNNQVAFYNANVIAVQGAKATGPVLEGTVTATQAGQASGSTIGGTCTTTGNDELVVGLFMAGAQSNPSYSVLFGVGTKEFDSLGGEVGVTGSGCLLSWVDLVRATPGTPGFSCQVSAGTPTIAMALVMFAILPISVNATVVAPAAAATASRTAPQAGPGVGAVSARATASGVVPVSISGALRVFAVPGLATASRGLPQPHSSRIEVGMETELAGSLPLGADGAGALTLNADGLATLELVEDP